MLSPGTGDPGLRPGELPPLDAAALYRVLVAASPDGIVAIDAQRCILMVNPALERMFGYAAGTMIGIPLELLMPARLRPHHDAGVTRYLATGVRRLDWRGTRTVGLRADGSEFPLLIAFGETEIDGRHLFLGFLSDVSEKVAVATALVTAQKLHETILSSVGEGIIGRNGAGDIIFVNAAAARILGASAEDLVGRNFHDAVRHSDALGRPQPPDNSVLTLALQLGQSVHLPDDCFWRKDGTSVPVDVVSMPMERGTEHTGDVLAFRDITAKRALERQLRQKQKMEAVGELAGGVAHDFNNLLTVILSHAQFLLDAPVVGEGPQEDATAIRDAALRAAALTRQLLAFSRRQVLLPAAIHLQDVVAKLEPMLNRLIGEHIRFVTEARTARDLVLADRGQLEQVIINLVLNARDAMPRGGTITVEVGDGASADEVVLHVRDTGVGMREDVVSRAFEPFFTTKPSGEGTGLGLATAFGIVSQSGGRIDIASVVDVGTTVTVTLPRVSAALERSPAVMVADNVRTRAVSVRPDSGPVILLVEDEESVRRVAARILRNAGYVVLEAYNGAHALLIAAEFQGCIAVLLTDVVMPEVSGVELADWYRSAFPAGAVIFMSGYTDDDLFRQGLTREHIRFVNKPFSGARLLEAVADAL